MTKAEIIALQHALGVDEDGRYGPVTRAAYKAYLDQDPMVPTIVPPAVIPWWQSKTALFTLATIIVSLASLFGIDIEKQQLTEVLTAALTLITGLAALWANARRVAPIDNTLVAPGVRLVPRASKVSAQSGMARDTEHGPFGY